MSFLFGRRSRAKRTKLRPQLPCWCREHGSERARSKLQHHPQLCAKPPHRRLTARPPAASSLPTGGAPFRPLARSPRPVWPHSLAHGGRSAHLAGLRSTQSPLPSQPDPSGRHPEQSQRAAPSHSCFFCGDRSRRGGVGSTQQMPWRRARIVGPCIRWQEGGGQQGAARC